MTAKSPGSKSTFEFSSLRSNPQAREKEIA